LDQEGNFLANLLADLQTLACIFLEAFTSWAISYGALVDRVVFTARTTLTPQRAH
jgi:hypothetical protein